DAFDDTTRRHGRNVQRLGHRSTELADHMSREARVDFTQAGAVGTLTHDNPPLNLISEELIRDLLDAIAEVETAREVRALLVRGNGKVFIAGADVALFAGKMRPLISSPLQLGRRIERLPFPTLAAVH